MARIVNPEEYQLRRNKILESAQRLIYTRGYEGMSIQDILADQQISKGAFYHYFPSKQALLKALFEQMAHQVLQLMAPITQHNSLSAADKLRRVFDVALHWKTERKEVLLSLVSVWYADENAALRQKAQAALLPIIAPKLTQIVRQGIREGVFHNDFPDHVSGIMFSILQNFGDSLVALIVKPAPDPHLIQHLEAVSASHQDAIERLLGAQPGSLPLFDTDVLREWLPLSNPSN